MEGSPAAAGVNLAAFTAGSAVSLSCEWALRSVSSADIGYAGGTTRDISAARSVPPTCNQALVQQTPPPLSKARILDTLQKKRGAGCYTGLDNTSWADQRSVNGV
jgi:hypothetical protein